MRLLILFFFLSGIVRAQIDSALTAPLLGFSLGGQVPFADMATRFGPNLSLGGSFLLKTKKNWLVGLESNFMFGRNVKEDVLKQLKTSDGFVIDNEGYPADLRITERGFGIHLVGGRIFKVANTNPNSGLMIHVGAGYLQHKINLYDAQQKIAAIKGDLKHGFDRLTNGVSLSQFIGYLFLSENHLLNFYAGFEFYEAFTKSVRQINYDTGLPDITKRLDVITGFKFGWILPLYKKKPNDFYYN